MDTSVYLTTGSLRATEGGILNGLNSISLEQVSLNDPNLRVEGGILNGLDSNELLENSDKTVAEATREVLAYVYSCAMPVGTSMVIEIDGDEWLFEGEAGLAPEWGSHQCDQECEEWVSACVLARTNAFDKPVLISLRGDHPELQPGPAEEAAFTLREGSYYGNIFQGAILDHAYACAGGPGGAMWELTDRFCAVIGDDCPITTVADCNIQEFACNPQIQGCNTNTACSDWDGANNPTTCYSESHNCGETPSASAEAYNRVITVYLKPPATNCGDGICDIGEKQTCSADCADHWAVRFGSGCHEDSGGVATDPGGNVVIAGRFIGPMDMGSVALATTGDSDQDLFVAKLDADGGVLWAKQIGETGQRAMARAVAMDAAGNVFVAGHFDATIDFDLSASPGTDTFTSQTFSYFLAKYDANGNFVKALELPANENPLGSSLEALPTVDLTVDGARVYITASFRGRVDLGSTNVNATSEDDVFVAAYDTNLTSLEASAEIFGTAYQFVSDIDVDDAGDVLVVGRFEEQLRSGNVTLSAGTSDFDGYVVKLNRSDLSTAWAGQLAGSELSAVMGVTGGSNGSVAITGLFRGTANVPGSHPDIEAVPDSSSAFVIMLDSSGDTVWAKSYGSAERTSMGVDIDWDDQEDTVVAALTVSALPGDSMLVEGASLEPGEYSDIVLLRYAMNGEATHMMANGSSVREVPRGLVASGGEISLAGQFMGTLKFTGTYLTNAGGSSATPRPSDLFVTRISQLPEVVHGIAGPPFSQFAPAK